MHFSHFAPPSSFNVGQLFADEAILQFEEINPADMSLFAGGIHPIVAPARHTAEPQAENLLNLDVSLGRGKEEIVPKAGNRFLPYVYRAIGGWVRVLENAIVAHQLHHPGDIMAIEGLIKLKDHAHTGLYL